ncbi:hypothetical protein BOTCAL_0039g00210 [Botryotinia calthae]|uniref:Peptidase A1 domain-containing protein n=1 Tax=Botryotinia calthae TaxID=38488 RepID=A0A4Y8DCF6_9HELO|nr:hypothetical protein BOTCAL_0039g00210 [Botryotinia calthae]
MYTQFFFVLFQFLGSATSRPNVAGQGYRPAAFQGPTTPKNVDTFFTLTPGINRRNGNLSGIAPANPLQKGHDWYTDLIVEGQTYPVVIDTGYAPGSGFKRIPNQHFNTTYASGENLKGTFGCVDVTLGGIPVNSQIATVDTAAWLGDGTTSGLLGLAYPSITAAFNGTTFENDNAETQRGLPPIASHGAWAVAPIQIVAIGEGYIQGALPWPQHQVYTLTPDNFIYPGSQRQKWNPKHWSPLSMPSSSSQVQLFIDSGTTLIFLPNSISSALAALYKPPAIYNADLFAYSVPCNAKVPYFAVVIGGVSFPVDPRDMVQDDNTGTGNCVAGVSDGDPFDFYTLGDVFLKNVVVVFDVGASQLKLGVGVSLIYIAW